MNLETAITVIEEFLSNAIPHTGPSGFEGLVAVLLQEATCQEFRLSSSGRQAGRDAGSESGYGNSIKVEAKHYRKSTPLNLRELIAEISESAESDPDLDMWVLATSRKIDDQIASALDKQAKRYGIEVVLLDLGLSGLPRLAVLMAAHPELVIRWAILHRLNHNPTAIRAALATLGDSPEFEPSRDRLLAKLGSTMGYNGARNRSHKGLLRVLGDEGTAKHAFSQSLGIRVPGTQVVNRSALNKRFDEWWEGPNFSTPVVVLGEERTGKTWAVFDWVAGRIDRGDMPLTLPLAAVAEELTSAGSFDKLLPKLLAKWIGVGEEVFWKRRLDRWMSNQATARPLFLLILDGINERTDIQWRPFFSVLQSEPWREKIAVLVTDRPQHWHRYSCEGLPGFQEIRVTGYSDSELDQALSARGLSHDLIPIDLLPLISAPGYCRLVADHYHEMIQSADFTRERLIYLEIKDRYASKLHYPLTDKDLFEIIGDLAKDAARNPTLSPKELRLLIGARDGNEANIYEEIVSGGLVVPVVGSEMIQRYRVDHLRLVFGYGMLLVDELVRQSSPLGGRIEEFLTSWFEPHPDMDLKVEICGSALFHALFLDNVPEVVIREILRYWLGLRNWADTAQIAFTDYVLRRPNVFVEVAEEFWSSSRDSGAAQAFLRNAFVAHRDNSGVQPILVKAVERWMGFVHPLGRHFWDYDAARKKDVRRVLETQTDQTVILPGDEAGEEETLRGAIQARAGCSLVPGEIEVAGVRLTVISDGFLLRLARFGLMIISAGNRLPFIQCFVHWAVASAVMDDGGFFDPVSWVLRLSDEDLEQDLFKIVALLLERHESTASSAARILLAAFGSKDSNSLIQQYGLVSAWHEELKAQHALDPCKSLFPWSADERLSCLGREDVALRIILQRTELEDSGPLSSFTVHIDAPR